MMVSPVIPDNDHPVWGDMCHFQFPLQKGAAPQDGMRIVLNVTVREDATAVEQMIPGMNQIHQHRRLGVGQLDLTELCLGENLITGQPLPGVRDAWMELSLPQNHSEDETDCNDSNNDDDNNCEQDQRDTDRKLPAQTYASTATTSMLHHSDHSDVKKDPLVSVSVSKSKDPPNNSNQKSSNSYGQVRVLVSYQPVGLEPQLKDIVAFESFARHSLRTMSCPPIIDPLLPLTVLDRRGSFLLVEYIVSSRQEKVCLRVHRNAVFVIERQNIIDAATNLALLPVDVALSTPIGRATQRAVTPVVVASRELLMPAFLSAKLVWMAARTTGLGVTHGLLALTGTLWHEGTTSLTGGGNNNNNGNHSNHHSNTVGGRNNDRHRSILQDRRSNATAKFVQL
jgi:hypothetical protein